MIILFVFTRSPKNKNFISVTSYRISEAYERMEQDCHDGCYQTIWKKQQSTMFLDEHITKNIQHMWKQT